MKKILFIIPCVPYPLNSGGNQAIFNMVDFIRTRLSASIVFEVRTEEEQKQVATLKELWQDVEFHVFTNKDIMKPEQPLVKNRFYYEWLKKIKSSIERKMRRQQIRLQSQPAHTLLDNDAVRQNSVLFHSVSKELDAKFVDYIAQTANSGFDIIQVEFYELIALGYVLPSDVETIFVHHELRYIRNENEMALFEQVTPEDSMCFLIAKDFERNALRNFKHVISLTEVDRQLLAGFMEREDRIYTSPAVVQLPTDSNAGFMPCTHQRFTFVGFGGHFPNLDAVVWFCKEVAPHLRKQKFTFTFQVIGKGYDPYLNELTEICPEIVFTGYVEKLEPLLQNSIALVPIRIGSGMRMKILDMVSLNVPFITTSKGLEGIQLRDGTECLIADSAHCFAEVMMRLSSNIELQEKLVNQAKIKLKELYNPQAMLEQRLSIYSSILKDKE